MRVGVGQERETSAAAVACPRSSRSTRQETSGDGHRHLIGRSRRHYDLCPSFADVVTMLGHDSAAARGRWTAVRLVRTE
jgi:hypothetical protein